MVVSQLQNWFRLVRSMLQHKWIHGYKQVQKQMCCNQAVCLFVFEMSIFNSEHPCKVGSKYYPNFTDGGIKTLLRWGQNPSDLQCQFT